MQSRLFIISLATVFALGVNSAAAQAPVDPQKTQEIQKKDTLPPMTDGSKSDQGGKQESSSKVPTSADQSVLWNGELTSQGSPKDIDTVPAKFSQRSTADDNMPIVGYRLKQLSADQRRDIADNLRPAAGGAANSPDAAGYATLGMELPSAITLQGLGAMPAALSAKYPELRGTGFLRSDGKMVIVDLDNNLVVGVLGS